MNSLVDENVHRSVIERRVDAGHAVRAVGTVAWGATDAEVVGLAVREGRVIVTADRDFAELAARLPGCPSIVLARSNSVSSPSALCRVHTEGDYLCGSRERPTRGRRTGSHSGAALVTRGTPLTVRRAARLEPVSPVRQSAASGSPTKISRRTYSWRSSTVVKQR